MVLGMPPEDVLPVLLSRRAAENPEAALIVEVGGRTYSRSQVLTESLSYARIFQDLGVRAGDAVLTMLPSRASSYAAWIGVSWLRAAEVGINLSYLREMLKYIINHSQASVAVIDAPVVPRWLEVIDDCPQLETVLVAGEMPSTLDYAGRVSFVALNDVLAQAEPLTDLAEPKPWDSSAIIYTSGTTGPSKGVIVPWAQLHVTAKTVMPGTFDERDCYYTTFPFAHLSSRSPLYQMLLAGGRIATREPFSPSNFWSDVRENNCTISGLLFSMARFLMNQPERPDDDDNPLRKVVMVPLLPDVDLFKQRFGVKVSTLFTMTETSNPLVSGWDSDPASCGRPREGVDVRVVDEHDVEVPVGEIGELIVRTDEPWTMNAGYRFMPEATADAWRNGWFHTGDAFRRNEDGDHFFVDRIKDTIRRRGENISSMQLENIVALHPDVAECAAIGVASEAGEEEVRLFVVPVEGASIEMQALHKWMTENLPRFMRPRFMDAVSSLPKTPTAKIRKAELRGVVLDTSTWDARRDS